MLNKNANFFLFDFIFYSFKWPNGQVAKQTNGPEMATKGPIQIFVFFFDTFDS